MMYLDMLEGVKQTGPNRYVAFCPVHGDGTKHGKRGGQSLSVRVTDDGKELLHCFAGCTYDSITAELGGRPTVEQFVTRPQTPPRPVKATPPRPKREVAAYDYRDAAGNLVYQSVRFEYTDKDGGKTFLQRRPDVTAPDGWTYKLDGVEPLLYRLPELEALAPGSLVAVAEGEKNVDDLVSLGMDATTNSGGAGKWHDSHGEHLANMDVVIFRDNDEPGEKHAADVACNVYGKARSVRIVSLPVAHKGDVSDWIKAGGTLDELLLLVAQTPEYAPPPPPEWEARIAAMQAELAAEQARSARLAAQLKEEQRLNRALMAAITNRGHDPAARIAQVVVLKDYAEKREAGRVRGPEERVPIVVEQLAPKMGMTRQAAGRWITRNAEAGVWERHEGPKKESNGHDYRPLSVAPMMKGSLAEMLEAASRTVDAKTAKRGKYHPRKVTCPDRTCRSENIAYESRHVCRDCGHVFDEHTHDANPTVEQDVTCPETDDAATVEHFVTPIPIDNAEQIVPQSASKPKPRVQYVVPAGPGVEDIDTGATAATILNHRSLRP